MEKKEAVEIYSPKVIKKKYSLTVKTNPTDAIVKILNIRPKYKDGILLKEGNYKIEVSKRGYKKQISTLSLQHDIIKTITLIKQKEATVKNAYYLGGREVVLINAYYIHGGSHKNPTIMISKIKKINFNYSIQQVEGNYELKRIYIGPFLNQTQAEKNLPKVKAHVLKGAYVKKVIL